MPSFIFLKKVIFNILETNQTTISMFNKNSTAKYYLPKLQTTNHISQNTHKFIKITFFGTEKHQSKMQFTAPQFTKINEGSQEP